MKSQLFLIPVVILMIALSCNKSQLGFPKEPVITLKNFYPDSIQAGSVTDSFIFNFDFTDGDADIATGNLAGDFELFIKDSRDTEFLYKDFLPAIDEDVRDPKLGLQGTVTKKLQGIFFNIRDTFERDSLSFDFYLKDAAGNKSNVITTKQVYLYK